MNNIKINASARTLEMTKTFFAKASIFGTAEYTMLQKARKDYPSFTPVVKSPSSRNALDQSKGLTYDFMEAYIGKRCAAEKKAEVMDEFRTLRGLDENGKKIDKGESYQTVKAWFIATFPEMGDYDKKVEALKAKREALLKKLAANNIAV